MRGSAADRLGNRRDAIDKLGAEKHVGVVEHALLERDDKELRLLEVRLDHRPDVLNTRGAQSVKKQSLFVSGIPSEQPRDRHAI